MSEKRSKEIRSSIKIPVYKLEDCLEETDRIGEHCGFPKGFIEALVIGDWLTTYYLRRREVHKDSDEPLLSFFASCEKHFLEYKEVLLNVANEKHEADVNDCAE